MTEKGSGGNGGRKKTEKEEELRSDGPSQYLGQTEANAM